MLRVNVSSSVQIYKPSQWQINTNDFMVSTKLRAWLDSLISSTELPALLIK